MIIRSIQIVLAGMGFLLDFLAAVALRRLGSVHRMRTLPDRTRHRIERLGPTFIKLGQALSERQDLLPTAWTESLSTLQSHVPQFPAQAAVDTVERELGADIATAFASFERTPLAAGSVAQVHAASLKDGRDVVVKILRPHVGDDIRRDMRILIVLVHVFRHIIPLMRRHRTLELVQELARNLQRETDLNQEARNIRLFSRAFAGSETVFIPGVINEYSTTLIITQERSMGTPLNGLITPESRIELTEAFVDFYLKQFFTLGHFHADPHPGNLLVMSDGRLCVHDFGAVGRLDMQTREALLGFVAAFIHLDPEWLTDAATELGLIAGSSDRKALIREIDGILAELKGAAMAEWSLARTMIDIGRLSSNQTLSLPPHLAGLVRTVFIAESTLRMLNPEADLLELLNKTGDHLASHRFQDLKSELRSPRLEWELARLSRRLPAIAGGWIRSHPMITQPNKVVAPVGSAFEHAALLRAAGQIALGAVALGSYVAAALLMLVDRGPRVWGDIPLLTALVLIVALAITALILVRSFRRDDE